MNSRPDYFAGILQHAGSLGRDSVTGFLNRVETDYLETIEPAEAARHLAALSKLSAESPVEVLLSRGEEGLIDCTVLAFDHPFEFSIITGLMAAAGYGIESSDAFTLPRVKQPGRKRPVDRRQILPRRRDPMTDPVIVDSFRGRLLEPAKDFASWAREFTAAVVETIGLLDQEQAESTLRAKRLVNERVTRWLKARRQADPRSPAPASLEVVVQPLSHTTRLQLRSPDTPAFLYALSTAVSLHGLEIEKTRARTIEGMTLDEIHVVDRDGEPVKEPEAIQALQRSVLLTLQFLYFLDRASDPFTALERFEELSREIVAMPRADEWLELLRNPSTMADLARTLGASDFLWEDFIRWNADAMLPILRRHVRGEELCPPMRSLPGRLDQALAGARNFDEQRQRLNQFKDRELFLIDLNHILTAENPDAAFQLLSERLVFLAENLVATASRLAFGELARLYGRPRNARRENTGWAVFGLGKLGGVALGYASDIELLFLFEEDGETAGGTRGSLQNAEFFAILARETSAYIQAKREGIFQVDLRLRPYGSGGPLATSRDDFAQYYGPKGKAHAFERLALARLRWIAGDAKVGYEIERLRDQLLYDGEPLDWAAVQEISAKMRAQHCKAGKDNSKHGDGALADLEQAVQMLQVIHAKQAAQLRTPRLHEALDGLRRAGILSPAEFEELMGAYQFLRRLINAQRMLRGSAMDLLLPAEGSDELVHLARRMRYFADETGASLLEEFRRHCRAVKRCIQQRFSQ